MCGVAGFLGRGAVGQTTRVLQRLEYRGYDSAGVAYESAGVVTVRKQVGKLSALLPLLDGEGEAAIGHTRWATHGEVSVINAHPHTHGERWTVVCNGIVENYKELQNGEPFLSQTDTEVIPFLLESKGLGRRSFLDTMRQLKGGFAVLALCGNGKIYAAKNKSPLYLAQGKQGFMLASDPICFSGFSDSYYAFLDGTAAVVSHTGVQFYDFLGKRVRLSPQKLNASSEEEDKGSYDTYMRKEIYDTPLVLERIAAFYGTAYRKKLQDTLSRFSKLALIGCGTAYHAALYGALALNQITDKDCFAAVASEWRYADEKIDGETACIFVSQSGETADTLGAMEQAKQKGAFTVALTNVGYSSLAQRCDFVMPVLAGAERAVASTKAYVAQVQCLRALACALGGKPFVCPLVTKEQIATLEEEAARLASNFAKRNDLFVIGRKFDWVTAKECALKIQEIGYLHAGAHAAGELKHGFLALIERDSPVLTFATDPVLAQKTVSGALEAKARGARLTLVTRCEIAEETEFDEVVRVGDEWQATIFAQLLALAIATERGNDPDMPRNLAKSVTVE